jgi:hypothetical protein
VQAPDQWPAVLIVASCRAESSAFDYLDAPLERICGADIPTCAAATRSALLCCHLATMTSDELKQQCACAADMTLLFVQALCQESGGSNVS